MNLFNENDLDDAFNKSHRKKIAKLDNIQKVNLQKRLYRHFPFFKRMKLEDENKKSVQLNTLLEVMADFTSCMAMLRNYYTHYHPYNSFSEQEKQFELKKRMGKRLQYLYENTAQLFKSNESLPHEANEVFATLRIPEDYVEEFMPGDEYLKDPETVEKWKFTLTPVSYRKDDLKKRLERSGRLYREEEHIDLKSTGEEGVQLIKALCGLGNRVSNVNLPNYALQIPNLPREAVVETNALFTFRNVSPLYAGELPEEILKLIHPHVVNHDIIYKAAITKNRALVYEAFRNDPNIHGRLTEDEIHDLVDTMIRNTAEYCDL